MGVEESWTSMGTVTIGDSRARGMVSGNVLSYITSNQWVLGRSFLEGLVHGTQFVDSSGEQESQGQ